MKYNKVELPDGMETIIPFSMSRRLHREIPINENDKILFITDDTFRPDTLLHKFLFEYIKYKTKPENISVVVASGMHRPSTNPEMISKLGILDDICLYNHNPIMPFPIKKFKDHIIISIGTVLPHIFVGMSGGGKILIPGLLSVFGASGLHSMSSADAIKYTKEIEKKIDYCVNGIINKDGLIVDFFINNKSTYPITKKQYFRTNFGIKKREKADIVILEPQFRKKDFLSSMNVLRLCKYDILKKDGIIFIKSDTEDGIGVHYLFQALNGDTPVKYDDKFNNLICGRMVNFICSRISERAIQEYFNNPIKNFTSIDDALSQFINDDIIINHYIGADVAIPIGG